uniref:Immunoglobulin domain-containing protein n=1 Tax=Equus asinus TaxID=9793 RepID=A0A8C4PUT1_EQUAS
AQVGGQDKPSLSAWPSPVVPQGQHVNLWCHSHLGFDTFRLDKDDGAHIPELQGIIFQNTFLMGPVTPEYAGIYRCHGSYRHSPSVWSAPSDPLVIVVTGVYRKPSFLAQPSPLVQSGQNVTLQCCSEIVFDSFILHREGVMESPLHLVGQLHDGGSQATFLMGPVTTAHAGTYRCFGSTNYSSYEWSTPSDPLNITITGESFQTCPCPLWDADGMFQDLEAPGGDEGDIHWFLMKRDRLGDNYTKRDSERRETI